MQPRIHAYQIYYNEPTRTALDPAFLPLDNRVNERPDWYEYWPIRNFLLGNELDEEAHYGFFSPQFRSKTRLTGRQVLDFALQACDADVITFSPFPCLGAVFTNVFENGARTFRGFLEAITLFLQDLDPDFRPNMMVNDSRDVVYCNFFLARPNFWRVWLRVVERAFELAEDGKGPVAEVLRRPVGYKDNTTDMKIMVLERMTSFILSSGAFTIRNYPPFSLPMSRELGPHAPELKALDALKIRYRDTGEAKWLQEFLRRRDALLKVALPRQP